MSNSINVDDQDPAVVQAGGVWFHSGSSNEFDSTTSVALSSGATLTYSFTGSQIGVFGTLDDTSGGIVATYAIDTSLPVSVTYKPVPQPQYHQPLWVSPALTPTLHQLVVTVINVNSTSTTPPKTGHVWFDFFNVLPVIPGSLPITTSGSTSSTTTSSASTTTVTSSVTTTSTSTSTPVSSTTSTSSSAPTTSIGTSSANGATSQSNDGPNVGLIVGTSLAGALFVILCFALGFYFIRRSRKQRLEDLAAEYIADDEETKIIEPSQLRHEMTGNVYAQNGGYPSYPANEGLVPLRRNGYGYPGAAPGTPSGAPLMHGQGQGYPAGGPQHFDPYGGYDGQQQPSSPTMRLPSQMNLGPGSSAPSPPPNYYGNGNAARRQ